MSSNQKSWAARFAALTLLLLPLTAILAAEEKPDHNGLTYEQSQALKAAIGAKRKTLGESKDAFGAKNVRSSYSQIFKKLDDGTRQVSVIVDTAKPAVLHTEQQKWVFKPADAGQTKWEFVSEDVVDIWEPLDRYDGKNTAYSFGSMIFEEGGLKVTASNGSIVANRVGDRVAGLLVVANDLAYSYAWPKNPAYDVNYFRTVHGAMARDVDRKKDILFDPAFFTLQCDPSTCSEILKNNFDGIETLGDFEVDLASVSAKGVGAGLPKKTQDTLRDIFKDYSENRRDNGFAGFGPPPQEGNAYWTARVYRDEDHAVQLAYDNWEGFELVFATSSTGPLYGYYTDETLEKFPPYELELREDKQFLDFHVDSVKGKIDAALDEGGERVEGDLEFILEAKRELDYLPFAIFNNDGDRSKESERNQLFVNALQMDGEELTRVRLGFGGVAKLPRTVKAGEKMNIRIQYGARVMRKVNPSFIQVSRGGWMPFVSFGDMIPEFELTMRYPSRYTLLGIGMKRWEKDDGRVKTAFWKADRPVVFASFTLGKYINDAPKIEATKSDGTVIPVNVYVDEVSTQTVSLAVTSFDKFSNDVESQQLGGRGVRSKQLRPIGEQAVNSINLYREISGVDYPYGELNLVCDPFGAFYGQAPSSLVYLGFGVFRGEGTVSGEMGGGTNLAKFNKSVVAHEIGHQWWGAAITNANSRNYWFVETLAEYFSAIYLEQVYGRKEYLEQVAEWRKRVLDVETLQSVQNASSLWGGPNSGAAYQALVYNKGPLAFHMLRNIVGDEKFFDFIKKFSMELANKGEIVTRDIQMVAEQSLGGVGPDGKPYKMDLEWFFDQWLRGIAIPEYTFEYNVRETEDGGAIVSGKIVQKMYAGNRYKKHQMNDDQYRAKVPITVLGNDRKEYTVNVVVQGSETPFQFKVNVKPLEVELNKYMETLSFDVKAKKI
ncbi:MAG: M1 family aminopeptidase [Planctomycetota bacterium]|nr:M1 family aminopeptidase [Planctomycetota bacterium]